MFDIIKLSFFHAVLKCTFPKFKLSFSDFAVFERLRKLKIYNGFQWIYASANFKRNFNSKDVFEISDDNYREEILFTN